MHFRRKINPCSPGHGASCALCCGSHNMPRAVFSAEFPETGEGAITRRSGARCHDAMSCRHLTFYGPGRSRIGCGMYEFPETAPEKDRDFFMSTCRTFYCRAWDVLSDEEVLFAAKLTGDWFHYGLLINEIHLLKEIRGRCDDPDQVTTEEKKSLWARLRMLLNMDAASN